MAGDKTNIQRNTFGKVNPLQTRRSCSWQPLRHAFIWAAVAAISLAGTTITPASTFRAEVSGVPPVESFGPVTNTNLNTPFGPTYLLNVVGLAAAKGGTLRSLDSANLTILGDDPGRSGSSQSQATFLLDDILISGPADSVVEYSVNLLVKGKIGALATSGGSAESSVRLRYSTTSSIGDSGVSELGHMVVTPDTVTRSGIFSGFEITQPQSAFGVSPTWTARAGDVISILLQLETSVAVSRSSSTSGDFARADSIFDDTAGFDGLVFNFKVNGVGTDDFTANSVSGNIVNNLFVIPEPGTGLLLACGLPVCLAWNLRRKRRAC